MYLKILKKSFEFPLRFRSKLWIHNFSSFMQYRIDKTLIVNSQRTFLSNRESLLTHLISIYDKLI